VKLLEVVIKNFRQYGDENKITISTDPEKNFTIIHGVNGAGKSNFMNAVLWCMYGDEILKTYTKYPKGRTILNEECENTLSDDESAEVSVATYWGENEISLKLERVQTYMKGAGKVYRDREDKFTASEITQKGWEKKDFPDLVVNNKIIPKDLVGFFFFDGEKMDEYFRDTSKVKSNVEKISQIDVLTSAVSTLNSVIRKFDADVRKQASDGESELLGKLSEQNDMKDLHTKERGEIEARLIKIAERLEEIRAQILDNAPELIRVLENDRKATEERIKRLCQDSEQCRKDAKDLVYTHVSTVFATEALKSALNIIYIETERGVLPPNIKDTFLKELLASGVCICGRELKEDTEHRELVKKMMNSLVSSEIASDATDGKFIINDLLNRVNFKEEYLNLVKKQIKLKNEKEKEGGKLDSISQKLDGFDIAMIKTLNDERLILEKEQGQLRVRLGSIGNKLATATSEVDRINTSLAESFNKDKKRQKAERVRDYAKNLRDLMETVREKIVGNVRAQLEEETKNYFFNMIWKKEAFSNVQIIDENSEYKISVKSNLNKECLGDLSAGERQVLALAFTAALYHVSGYNVPVIIDTPLGRISDEPSENIAGSLPNYLSDTQVVMLVTDKEYSGAVRKKLSSHIGKEYNLKYDEKTKCSEVVPYA